MDVFKSIPSACDELARAMSKAVGFANANREARLERVQLPTLQRPPARGDVNEHHEAAGDAVARHP